MFTEMTQFRHLIINPPQGILDEQDGWDLVTKLVPCSFLVDPDDMREWQARWVSGGHLVAPKSGWPRVRAQVHAVLLSNGLQPHQAAYLTPDVRELSDAANSRVGTILWGAMADDIWPDLIVATPQDLVEAIQEYLSGRAMGYFGEVVATLSSTLQRSGNKGRLLSKPVPEDLSGRVECIALGRYFSSEDARYRKHQYTKRILEMKNRYERVLASTLSIVLKHLQKRDPFDWVTVVPPKPSRVKDSGLPRTVAEACKQAGGILFCPDVIKCPKDYPPQRGLSADARKQNVRGKYSSGGVQADHVLVVDDVVSTGSTLFECCRVLLAGGAKRITAVAFGLDQKVVEQTKELACPNPDCEGTLTVRIRRQDGTPFWGCTNYPRCNRTLDWELGLEKWNKLITCDDLWVLSDIAF